MALFWNACRTKADGIALEQCIQSAVNSTALHSGVWCNSNNMGIAISFLLFNGTNAIFNGDLPKARLIAAITSFFEQWLAISLHKSQFDWYWPKIYELYNANLHTLVSYFRNRIPCSCLDEKHKEVRSIEKMGICCNPRCTLPDRKLERRQHEM